MEYRNKSTGAVISWPDLKALHPDKSFPIPFTTAAAEYLGYDPVLEGSRPNPSTVYQSVVRQGEEQSGGIWFQKYVINTATGDAATAIDNEAARKARNSRNTLLKDSDWTQSADKAGLSDSKIAEWVTYRQALRDLPTASGWPHTHTEPTAPS